MLPLKGNGSRGNFGLNPVWNDIKREVPGLVSIDYCVDFADDTAVSGRMAHHFDLGQSPFELEHRNRSG